MPDKQPPLTRDQVRAVDKLAVDMLRVPSIVLMENAARQTADAIVGMAKQRKLRPAGTRVLIACGGGNNGGDGYAIARHLHNRGYRVDLLSIKSPGELQGDALTNATICLHMGFDIDVLPDDADALPGAGHFEQYAIIVDALLGTGFEGDVREPMATLITRINQAGTGHASVVAVDVPSGLDCQTGQPANAAIEADLTVTFVAEKVGFAQATARNYLGEVVIADIGTPPSLTETARKQHPT